MNILTGVNWGKCREKKVSYLQFIWYDEYYMLYIHYTEQCSTQDRRIIITATPISSTHMWMLLNYVISEVILCSFIIKDKDYNITYQWAKNGASNI